MQYSVGTTLEQCTREFQDEAVDLSNFQLAVLAVGHFDAHLDQCLFRARYLNFVRIFTDQAPHLKLLLCSLICLNDNHTWANMFRRRSTILRSLSHKDHDMNGSVFFVNMNYKMQNRGQVLPEFIHQQGLNFAGIEVFLRILGHKISGIKSLWPEKRASILS